LSFRERVESFVTVLFLAVASVLAHLGTPGHDFSTRPLFRYSFLIIECQIGIFVGVKEKQGGGNGRPIKSRNAPDSQFLFACNSFGQPGQGIDSDRKNRCGSRTEQKSRQADMQNIHGGRRSIHASFHRMKKIDSNHGLFLLSLGFGL